ncbi:MAG: hypothetical protein UU51_C0013G0001, partial [Microgenomates group bacterium GW2011_GWC1_41_20]
CFSLSQFSRGHDSPVLFNSFGATYYTLMFDEYNATWVSHSSISEFLKCPRAYYLKYVYKNPKTGHKMTVITPPLALGQAVHEVLESLAILPVEERLKISLVKKLDPVWLKITGKKGGFKNFEEEGEYRGRAVQMLINLQENPGPILEKAIKIKSKMNLPHYWLNAEEGIILSGKIDWLQYVEKDDSVRIIDFKTGKNEESLTTKCIKLQKESSLPEKLIILSVPRAVAMPADLTNVFLKVRESLLE